MGTLIFLIGKLAGRIETSYDLLFFSLLLALEAPQYLRLLLWRLAQQDEDRRG